MSWQEWDGEDGPEGRYVYYTPRHRRGEPRDLAQAVRSDGVTHNLYEAYRLVDTATYVTRFYGYLEEDREPVVCDEYGQTATGDQVDAAIACTFAILGE